MMPISQAKVLCQQKHQISRIRHTVRRSPALGKRPTAPGAALQLLAFSADRKYKQYRGCIGIVNSIVFQSHHGDLRFQQTRLSTFAIPISTTTATTLPNITSPAISAQLFPPDPGTATSVLIVAVSANVLFIPSIHTSHDAATTNQPPPPLLILVLIQQPATNPCAIPATAHINTNPPTRRPTIPVPNLIPPTRHLRATSPVYARSSSQQSHYSHHSEHAHDPHAYADGEDKYEGHHHHHHHHHHGHHHDDHYGGGLDEETVAEYKRRYAKDQKLEKRPTLGDSLYSAIGKVGKMLGSERR
ncbi:hypothetical protein CFE70_000690 [Pyrenophora teres f. teres 0-1]